MTKGNNKKCWPPTFEKAFLEEQSASKLKMLSVHKLSVSGALLLSPKSLWIADRRTVTMNQARLRLAIASPAICRAHSLRSHLHHEHSKSWTINPPKHPHVQQEGPKPRWYLSLPWSLMDNREGAIQGISSVTWINNKTLLSYSAAVQKAVSKHGQSQFMVEEAQNNYI